MVDVNERDREAAIEAEEAEFCQECDGKKRVAAIVKALATARAEGFAAGVAERERDDVVARIAEWSRRFPFIVMIPLADAISAGYWRQS